MSAVRDLTHSGNTGVAFEVERVGWPTPDRLEVVGRWFGVRGRRFIRPTLNLEVDGAPRRLLAVLDHKPWAVEDGEEWTAAFAWDGEPADLTGAELTVGSDIAVELGRSGGPRPDNRRFARRPRADVLEGELASAREKAQRLGRELHAARADHRAELLRTATEHEEEVERVRAERVTAEREADRRAAELSTELDAARDRVTRLETALQKAREELAVARADVAAGREGLEGERAALADEAANAAAGEVEQLRAERDAARSESAKARGERDAAVRDRDRARQERRGPPLARPERGEKRRDVQLPSAETETAPTVRLPAPPAPPLAEVTPAFELLDPRPPARIRGDRGTSRACRDRRTAGFLGALS